MFAEFAAGLKEAFVQRIHKEIVQISCTTLGLYVLPEYVWKRESNLHTTKLLLKLVKKHAFVVAAEPVCDVGLGGNVVSRGITKMANVSFSLATLKIVLHNVHMFMLNVQIRNLSNKTRYLETLILVHRVAASIFSEGRTEKNGW